MNDFGGIGQETKIEVCNPPKKTGSILTSRIRSWIRIMLTGRLNHKRFRRDAGLILFGILWFAVIARLFYAI